MQAGKLRNKIIILKNTPTRASDGGEIDNWTEYCILWAQIKPATGKEWFASERLNAEITHNIKTRYKSGITPKMKIKFNDRLFNIVNVINYNENNKTLIMQALEVV